MFLIKMFYYFLGSFLSIILTYLFIKKYFYKIFPDSKKQNFLLYYLYMGLLSWFGILFYIFLFLFAKYKTDLN